MAMGSEASSLSSPALSLSLFFFDSHTVYEYTSIGKVCA